MALRVPKRYTDDEYADLYRRVGTRLFLIKLKNSHMPCGYCYLVDSVFTLLAGAICRYYGGVDNKYENSQEFYIKNGTLVPLQNNFYVSCCNIDCGAPSEPAALVMGRTCPGPVDLVEVGTGKTLRDLIDWEWARGH